MNNAFFRLFDIFTSCHDFPSIQSLNSKMHFFSESDTERDLLAGRPPCTAGLWQRL